TGVIDTAIHISGLLFSTLRTDIYARCRRPTFTFTITIGRLTTRRLSQRQRPALVITIGGSRRFTKSTSRRATPHPSTNLLLKSPFPAGRQTANRSHSSKV